MSEQSIDPAPAEDPATYDQDGMDAPITGPDGVEGADDILEADRDRTAQEASDAAADYVADVDEDRSAAAEQGNREGDEMVSEGADPDQVVELGGDAELLDVVEDGGRQQILTADDEALGVTGDLEEADGDVAPL